MSWFRKEDPKEEQIDPARIIPATGPWGIPDADFWDIDVFSDEDEESQSSEEEESEA